jgi:hypothetical protein
MSTDSVIVNDQEAIRFSGDLQLLTPFVAWTMGEPRVDMDGEFTPAELRAIAAYMENPDYA